MSEYKGIKGLTIQEVASDPPAPIEGQVWYNTTTSALKGYINNPGSWSTGGDLPDIRQRIASAGTQTAALAFGGFLQGWIGNNPPFKVSATDEYNGTSWTRVSPMNTARWHLAGTGTQTSAIAFGGGQDPGNTGATELYNGSTWTEVNDLNTGRFKLAGCGTQTAALAFGGEPDFYFGSLNESWNGTNWTEVNDLNNGRRSLGGAGTQTAGLAFGGDPGFGNATEKFNGTNWTEVSGEVGTYDLGGGGTQTSAIAAGGYPYYARTRTYNGTTWTERSDMIRGRQFLSVAAADNTAALAIGGQNPADATVGLTTLEWNVGLFTKTLSTE